MKPPIFTNSHFLAVDKPHSTLSVPPRFPEDERVILSRFLEKEFGARLFPVHRLDFEVTGLILYALTAEAHRAANHWFEERLVHKRYEALTPKAEVSLGEAQLWKSLLVRGKKRSYERPFGKKAETLATPSCFHEGEILEWRLEPKTGRPHQLRFELAKRGMPVLGDSLYGSNTPLPLPGAIALRSVELDFSQVGERFGLPQILKVDSIWKWYLENQSTP